MRRHFKRPPRIGGRWAQTELHACRLEAQQPASSLSEVKEVSQLPSPSRCPDCGEHISDKVALRAVLGSKQPTYNKRCHCGVILVWTHPGRWIRRHVSPSLDAPELRVEVKP